MTILPTLVNPVPLPAPITSGSGVQSYTDPMGDVWVAANGVNGGAWKRARDALFCEYNRVAAFTFTGGAWINFGYDTRNVDNYSMYNSSTGIITLPVTGIWRFTQGIAGSATATGQYVQVGMWSSDGSTYLYRQSVGWASAASTVTAEMVFERLFTGGTQFMTRVASNAALAGNPNTGTVRQPGDLCFFTAMYVGTG
jgi:hypothetical protein